MVETPQLLALQKELAASNNFEARRLAAAAAVEEAFRAEAGGLPSESALLDYFEQKNFSAGDLDLQAGGHSWYELQQAFTALLQKALFVRWQDREDEARICLDKAAIIAQSLGALHQNQHIYVSALSGSSIRDKLYIEMQYESVNSAFLADANEAHSIIGSGLNLAAAIADQKRRADFLAKSQYALYETLQKYAHVALSLGFYLRSSELESDLGAEYPALKAWSNYRSGNIQIDLGAQKKEAKRDDEAPPEYEKAKSYYESALDWALNSKVWYAVMLLQERLGAVSNRLERYEQARDFYRDSLKTADDHPIKPELVKQNAVRCGIGLGNVAFESASKSNMEEMYASAGTHFFEAYSLANQINYAANKEIARACIKNLVDKWPGSEQKAPKLKAILVEG